MLKIEVPEQEFFDDVKQQFVYTKPVMLTLEHSLVSISKWEAKWKVPFMIEHREGTKDALTQEQVMDYIRCMTVTPQNVDDITYFALSKANVDAIMQYMQDKQTATWFGKTNNNGPRDRRPLTSERIYYLMIHYGIPEKFEKWHINRLLTLIQICQEEEKQQEKKSPKDAAMARHNLNAARRAKRPHL